MPRALVVCVCLAAAVVLSARQQTPVFRTGVDLVAVDVVVVDRDGVPVRGLSAADFTVTLEGQRRPVQALDYLEFGATSVPSIEPAPSRTTTNDPARQPAASRGARTVVFLVDDLSAKPTQGKALRVAAERVLASLDPTDLVGVTSTSGLGPVVNPTRDRAAVAAALASKGLTGRDDDTTAPFYITVPEAIEIDRGRPPSTLEHVSTRECAILDIRSEVCSELVAAAGRRLARYAVHRAASQIASYLTVIRALRAAPAPRVVIALTSGLATGTDKSVAEELAPVTRAAAESGVLFYAVTELGDPTDASEMSVGAGCLPPCVDRPAARRDESNFLTSGVQALATAAGGEAFRAVGQPDRFLSRVLSETSGIYRLGVTALSTPAPGRFFNVKVTVNRPGLTVRANRHALVPAAAAAAPPSVDDLLREKIAQGGVGFGVPIALATALRRDPASDGLQLAVNVQVPAGVPGPLTAMYAALDERGQTVNAGRRVIAAATDADGYWIAFPVPLAAGTYRLRFSVADGQGSVGSVEHAVAARLTRVGAYQASDLILSWKAAEGPGRFLALETVPSAAVSVSTTLELYPEGPAPPASLPTIRFDLTRVGETTPTLERDVTPAAGRLLSATTEIPTSLLEAGSYTIRATVIEGGQPLGSATATFRMKQ